MTQTATAGNKGDRIRSDCQVRLELTRKGGHQINLHSKVDRMFGRQIREQAAEVLNALGVDNAILEIEDSGALPFVIGARIEAAVRKLKSADSTWIPPLIEQNRYETGSELFRFSRLYLPGNSPAMMLNAGLHGPDGIILDLEDSVAPDKKDEARLLVRNALDRKSVV